MDLNASDFVAQEQNLVSSIWQSMPNYLSDKITLLFDIGKILLIIIIIYFIIKIISQIIKLKDSRNLSKIANQVSEINQKISSFLERQKSKEKPQKLDKAKK
ncbi:MAG: hypothetical protein AABX85_02600 [Nanoarchaeota archaeon]